MRSDMSYCRSFHLRGPASSAFRRSRISRAVSPRAAVANMGTRRRRIARRCTMTRALAQRSGAVKRGPPVGLTWCRAWRDVRPMSGLPEARSRQLPAGTTIFRQGDAGDDMFVISSGHVSLRVGVAGHEREMAVLGPGDFFGELSLLANLPRTATAVATADTTLLTVRRETFALMMQDELDVVFRMMDALGRRLADTNRHVEELARAARHVRAVARALEECLAGGEAAVVGDVATIARAADVPVAEAETVIGALVARGVGRYEGGSWLLDPRADGRRLAGALATTR